MAAIEGELPQSREGGNIQIWTPYKALLYVLWRHDVCISHSFVGKITFKKWQEMKLFKPCRSDIPIDCFVNFLSCPTRV